MPPDTSHIPGQILPPPPEFQHVVDSLLRLDTVVPDDAPQFQLPEWQLLLIIMGVLAIFFFVSKPLRSYTESWLGKGLARKANKLLEDREIIFDDMLTRHNPYYRSLPPEQKKVFILRVAAFLCAKHFRYHSLEEEEVIPVLISGAAVQMTFGLRNYLMDYFPVIHVIRQEYHIPNDRDIYYGHVSKRGIHVAWNHFIEGYSDYEDAVNVGLHEMAHAVSFDVFLGESDHHDYQFKRKLLAFTETGKPVFRAMRQGDPHILDEYATTNFDEFWAVCVENFFENAAEFSQYDPDLYISICELLNQDPLTPGKVRDTELAGH